MPRESLKGPGVELVFCGPDQILNPAMKFSYSDENGWNTDGPNITIAKAEVNTIRYKIEDDDCSVELAGPGAGASCGASSEKFKASAQLSVFKVKSEAGPVMLEVSPNLNSSVSFGVDGISTKVAGVGATVSLSELSVHTPLGSIGVRLPFGNIMKQICSEWRDGR